MLFSFSIGYKKGGYMWEGRGNRKSEILELTTTLKACFSRYKKKGKTLLFYYRKEVVFEYVSMRAAGPFFSIKK